MITQTSAANTQARWLGHTGGVIVVFIVAAIGLIFAAAMFIAGRWSTADTGIDRPTAPQYPPRWSAEALRSVRFRPALRGYRMEDVDQVLSTLAAQLAEQESAGQQPAQAEEADSS